MNFRCELRVRLSAIEMRVRLWLSTIGMRMRMRLWLSARVKDEGEGEG